MGASRVNGPLTTTADGVAVEKRVETEAFPRPATVFDVSSTRDEPVTIRLVDALPDEIEIDRIGFHADHGDEYWSKDGRTVVFEYELPAGGEYSTLYAIHDDEVPLDAFLTEPDVEVGEAAGSDADGTSPAKRSGSDDAAASADEEVTDEEVADEEPAEEIDAGETADSGPREASLPNESETATTTGSQSGKEHDAGSVVDELLCELREGSISAEKRAALQSELQPSEGSVDARLRRVQSDVADLRAYTDALETFLDENGTGQQLLDDLRADLERVESDVASIDARAESNEDELESINYSVAEIDGELESLDEEVGAIDESLSSLQRDVETLEKAIPDDDVTERVDEMESQLESVRSWQEHVKSAFERSFDPDRLGGGEV